MHNMIGTKPIFFRPEITLKKTGSIARNNNNFQKYTIKINFYAESIQKHTSAFIVLLLSFMSFTGRRST